MKTFVFILLAALTATSANAAETCALTRLASLDMHMAGSRNLAVPIAVSDADRMFLVELDSAEAAIAKSLADELKLRMQPLSSRVKINLGGENVLGSVALPDVQIGTVHATNVNMYVVPQVPSDIPVSGSIGTSLLSSFDVEMDFSSGKLNLYSPTQCQGNSVYWASSYAAVPFHLDRVGVAHFEMQLDGKPVDVTIDMDSEHARMGTTAASALLGIDVNSPEMKPVPDSSALFSYPFRSLSIGDVAIYNPAITLFTDTRSDASTRCRGQRQNGDYCFGGSDLAIGLTELRRLHLYFAFKENMLYVTAADAHK